MTYRTSKIAQRLKSLTGEPVVSLQNVLGFRHTSELFNNIVTDDFNDLSGSSVPFSRGLFPLYESNDPNNPEIFGPTQRTVNGQFFTARNRVYDDLIGLDYERLFYKPKIVAPFLEVFQSTLNGLYDEDTVFYTYPSCFDPGGELFNRAVFGENWQIDHVTAEDIFGPIPANGYTGPGFSADVNGPLAGASGGSIDSLISLITNAATGGHPPKQFIPDSLYSGNGLNFTSNPMSLTNDHLVSGMEIIQQFNAYPSASTLGGEVAANPQEFSMLLYDAKRNSHFSVSINTLAGIISQIASVNNGLITANIPSVNLTMPLLTTAQLNTFYQVSATNTGDLNADGSVSTADLLEFLTAFGSVVPDPSGTSGFNRLFDSVFAVHNIELTDSFPFFATSTPNFLPEPLESSSSQSFGSIDLDSYAYVGSAEEVGSLATNALVEVQTNGNIFDVFQLLPANALLAIKGYEITNGAPFNVDDIFDASAVGFFGGEMGPINNFGMNYSAFTDALNIWQAPDDGVPLRLESFPEDGGLNVTTSLNYFHPNISIVFNNNIPSDFTGAPLWTNQFTAEDKAPDYVIFSGGAEVNVGPSAIADRPKPRVSIEGFVECEEGSGAKVLLYAICGSSTLFDPIVTFFGFVDPQTTTNSYVTESGKERHPFSFFVQPNTIDPQAGISNQTPNYTILPNGSLQNAIQWPSSYNEAQPGLWNMYFSIGALCFHEPTVNRVVITSTIYRMMNTHDEFTPSTID